MRKPPRLEPQSMVLLWSRFCTVLAEVCDHTGVRDWQIVQTRFKTPEIVGARLMVVRRILESFEYTAPSADQLGKLRLKGSLLAPPEPPWKRISTTVIAHLFDCDHSSIVIMLQRDRRPTSASGD